MFLDNLIAIEEDVNLNVMAKKNCLILNLDTTVYRNLDLILE